MIPLAKPIISSTAIDAINKILLSGNLVQGEYVAQFENNLAQYLHIKNAIAVSSGTAALHLALLALDIKPGDEVIIPAFTFPATANVVELVGAKPILADINLSDYCIDVAGIEKLITSRTKAIMPVHEFGQTADMDALREIANNANIPIIEDAACAIGSKFKGQMAGTFGEIGCFSFHPRKTITTGEGGLLTTNNDQLAAKLRSLRNHGIVNTENKMDFCYAGLNYRLTEIQAVLGLTQLAEIDQIISQRIAYAHIYHDLLSSCPGVRLPKEIAGRTHSFQSYQIMLPGHISRMELTQKLLTQGIQSNLGAQAIPCLTYYREKYHYLETDFPNAVSAFTHGLVLPLGPHLTENDIIYITSKLQENLLTT